MDAPYLRLRVPRLWLVATLLLVVLPVTAAPAAAGSKLDPVGGPLLSSPGVVARLSNGAPGLPRKLSAHCWLVADLDTGEVLATRDPHGRYLPASTIKALTAVALIPNLNPKSVVRPTFETLDFERGSSRVGLLEGRPYTVAQLFTAMLVASGNDASNALAQAVGGTPAAVALMNDAASNIQAGDTRAANAHGLDAPGQVTSCYDLALIGRAALTLPDFRRYSMIRKSLLPKKGGTFEIYTHNKLFTNNYRGAFGGKSGFTSAAKATFVGFAEQGGRRLVVTIMKADAAYYNEVKTLLDWGFAAAAKVKPVGVLVPSLVDVRLGIPAVAKPAPSKGAGPGAASPRQTTTAAKAAKGRLPIIGIPWWYVVPPLLLIPTVAAAVIARRRRRRRRGFYTPQTTLRLPVR